MVAPQSNRLYYLHATPEWRNWYTHQTQNLARFTPHVGSSPTSGTKYFIYQKSALYERVGALTHNLVGVKKCTRKFAIVIFCSSRKE